MMTMMMMTMMMMTMMMTMTMTMMMMMMMMMTSPRSYHWLLLPLLSLRSSSRTHLHPYRSL